MFDGEGQLNRDKHVAVNKMGHGLHVVDEDFKKVTHQTKMQEVAKACGFVEPVVIQSMAIFKPPKVCAMFTWCLQCPTMSLKILEFEKLSYIYVLHFLN